MRAGARGQGKCRELDTKCTVFKRAPDSKYNLKMKSAREARRRPEGGGGLKGEGSRDGMG